MRSRCPAKAFAAALVLAALPAVGQAQVVLASFDGITSGKYPNSPLALSGGTLYGTTPNGDGGSNTFGTVFSVPVSGGAPTVLASFNGTQGANPFGGLLFSGGTLYGTTGGGGGTFSNGTVFSLPATGGTPTVLATFNGTNGSEPAARLTLSGSTLYGTTISGGANNKGVVFSVPITGGTPTVLASFDGAHGDSPEGGVVVSGGTLYGTTYSGGANNQGVVYSVPVTGGTPTVLASFDDAHGTNPRGGLVMSGGLLYGAASNGGANLIYGTVFSVPVTGGTPTVLADFDGTHGGIPWGDLVLSADSLYGTSLSGGASNGGVVFSVPLSGGTPTVLASFDGPHGANPTGGLTLSGGTLYGATQQGGAFGDGVVFAVPVPEPGTLTLLMAAALGGWMVRRRGEHLGCRMTRPK
jgi:uncharacterized repeat protein (TIGR03803 family)